MKYFLFLRTFYEWFIRIVIYRYHNVYSFVSVFLDNAQTVHYLLFTRHFKIGSMKLDWYSNRNKVRLTKYFKE